MSSSARVPFVPTSRPASRAAHLKDQPQNPIKQKTNPQFLADVANPLHTSSNTQLVSVKPQPRPHTDTTGVSKQNSTSADKPLNMGGLLKKRNPQVAPSLPQNPRTSRRPSFPGSNAIARPDTADPHSISHRNQNQPDQALKIAAPVPRQAPRPSSPTLSNSLASGVFSFAPPTPRNPPPTPSQLQPTPESTQRPKDAHTLASGLGFSFSKSHTVTEQHQDPSQQLPSPPDTIRTSSTSVFESMSPVEPDHQVPLLPFTLNMSLPNQTGPQRVLLNPGGKRSSLNDTLFDQIPNADENGNGLGNRANQDQQLKRPRTELEHDEQNQEVSDDHSSHLKRYKNHTEGYKPGPQSGSSPHLPSSPEDTHAMPMSTEYRHHNSHQHYSQAPSTPPQRHDQGQNQQQQQHYQDRDVSMLDGDDDGPRTLDKLLGCDTDAYIEEHTEKYERAVNRWRECSMEEWMAGADELAAKYAKILDFVKDHMATKMKLFASFDAKVEKHNAVLDEREKALDGVRARLVQESGNVLGRG